MEQRTEQEKVVRKLVAINNLRVPLSSLYQKAKNIEKDFALGIQNYVLQKADFGNSIQAFIGDEEKQKARGMREGISEFEKQFPRYGRILNGLIEEKRTEREVYLKYGLNNSYTLADSEYVSVMRDIGLTDSEAAHIFPELISASYRLQKKKKEGLRDILIG